MLMLKDSDHTRGLWPHPFQMTYEVTLRRDRLKLELSVLNSGEEEMTFSAALHSYFEASCL